MKSLLKLLFAVPILIITVESALAQQSCPASVILSLSRAGSACHDPGRNEACYGNGQVTAASFDTASGLNAPGDVMSISELRQLETHPIDEGLSVAWMQVQANLPDSEQRSTTFLMFGEAAVENLVLPMTAFSLTARGNINIRAFPDITGEIVERLQLGEQVTVNGRTADEHWLRVRIPNSEALGWIPADVASFNDPVNALDMVDTTSLLRRPFEVFNVVTGHDDARCSETTESGLLIQTPNVFSPAHFVINGVDTQLAGTIFLQSNAEGEHVLYVLNGEFEVDGVFIPAGTKTSLQAREPKLYPGDETAHLPINVLPIRIQVVAPLTEAELVNVLAQHEVDEETEAVATESQPVARCRYTVARTANLWGGPGIIYEIINEVRPGVELRPVLATRDADGEAWWQLNNSNWIRAAVVDVGETCGDVPFAETVPPPAYNTLSLEDCMTTNGPLRAGQQVRIEFLPPAFDGYNEALAATQIDPGRIMVNERYLYIYADDPVLRSGTDNRYFRKFYTNWTAQPGTYRITGDRLTYELICNLTVPVGQ